MGGLFGYRCDTVRGDLLGKFKIETMSMTKGTKLRYGIAAISFHLTINLIVFALYGAEQAIWFLIGYGHAMF